MKKSVIAAISNENAKKIVLGMPNLPKRVHNTEKVEEISLYEM